MPDTATTPNNQGLYRPELSSRCAVCGTALAGTLGHVHRVFGIVRSTRNPNICTRCSTHIIEGRIVEVTVLFVDLVAFTQLASKLGPRKTHDVVDAYLRNATETIAAHNGFVDKYIGDAVMALFNVPVPRSDHPQDAVVSALAIIREMAILSRRFDFELEASAGVATGFAHVGRLGSDDVRDYTAIGDVVNLAARLQGKARAGEVLLSERTHAAAGDYGDQAVAQLLLLKGFPDRIKVFRVKATDFAYVPAGDDVVGQATSVSIGTFIFGVLGAPCAITTLLGPVAVFLGGSSVAGALAVIQMFDKSILRLPLLLLVFLAAIANLYTVWHAHGMRARGDAPAHLGQKTDLERRQTLFLILSSVTALILVGLELVVHQLRHG